MQLSRRAFVGNLSATSALMALGLPSVTAAQSVAEGGSAYQFFTRSEGAALDALIDTLIPASGDGPGALEAGVGRYIDGALLAAYGAGDGKYLEGPFASGAPQQGYQLPLTPAEFYRLALADLDNWAGAERGAVFAEQREADRISSLQSIEAGDAGFARVPSPLFFGTLWFDVVSGYFADPIYGGNAEMQGWKLVGYPGARHDLRDYVGRTDHVVLEPVGLQSLLSGEAR